MQGELEAAFKKVVRRESPILGSGRTDTGVHSSGMVAHIDLNDEWKDNLYQLQHSINGVTGVDVVLKDMRIVPDDFHARFSAISREYIYTVLHAKTAIYRELMWQVWGEIDVNAMQQAASELHGKMDFTSYSKQTDAVKDYFCTIIKSEWERQDEKMLYTIKANRFVRGMVRSIVGSMLEVGKGRLSLTDFKTLLRDPQELERAKYIAPAHGLILRRVEYPPECNLW